MRLLLWFLGWMSKVDGGVCVCVGLLDGPGCLG